MVSLRPTREEPHHAHTSAAPLRQLSLVLSLASMSIPLTHPVHGMHESHSDLINHAWRQGTASGIRVPTVVQHTSVHLALPASTKKDNAMMQVASWHNRQQLSSVNTCFATHTQNSERCTCTHGLLYINILQVSLSAAVCLLYGNSVPRSAAKVQPHHHSM